MGMEETEPVSHGDVERVIEHEVPLDLRATLAPLAGSRSDPTATIRGDVAWKALRTPAGPATVAVRRTGPHQVSFWGWGPGSEMALQRGEDWLGLSDPLESFDPDHHPVVAKLARERRGARMGRFGQLAERLVPTILGQLVIAKEAKRSYNRLVRQYGEVAPGPVELHLAPEPSVLAELGSHHFHRVGVERKRASIVQRIARDADRLDRLVDAPLEDAYRYLLRIPGIGPWTTTSVGRVSFGDPDAVVVGDYNLPHLVAWALVGKRRSDDEEMLELLAPFTGHRGRVQALLKSSPSRPPRHGPKLAFREIEKH